MTIYRRAIILFAISIITSCVVGPNYKPPPTIVPHAFKEAQGKTVVGKKHQGWKEAHPQDERDRGPWWTVFNDPTLNKLEDCLNLSNQSIQTAYANYVQARALVDQARAAYFPIVSITETASRAKKAGASLFPGTFGGQVSSSGGAGGSSSQTSTSHSVILNGTWQPDLWGLVRRTVESNVANAEASAALLANTRLSMQGTLAQTYFELRALDTDQIILNKTVQGYKKSLQLSRNQYQSGVASRAAILQAQSALEASQSQAINNHISRQIYEHAIAVLIGHAPADFNLSEKPLRHRPPPIPVVIPSELLERRPDIAQAERLMAAANAEIGVAIAAYFPSIALSGNVSNIGFGTLGSAWGWAIGQQGMETIFNGGLFAANVRSARAAYNSAIASYRQTVLTAFQNVEDNLVNLRILADEAIVQDQAEITAKKSLQLTRNQYKSGIVAYANVIAAQITALTAEKNAADITGQRMTAAVALIMALGGGWNAHCIEKYGYHSIFQS